jgi:hypothetical protein
MPRARWDSQCRSGRSERRSSRCTWQFRRPPQPGVFSGRSPPQHAAPFPQSFKRGSLRDRVEGDGGSELGAGGGGADRSTRRGGRERRPLLSGEPEIHFPGAITCRLVASAVKPKDRPHHCRAGGPCRHHPHWHFAHPANCATWRSAVVCPAFVLPYRPVENGGRRKPLSQTLHSLMAPRCAASWDYARLIG